MPYGTARPSSLIRKSCTRTPSGSPCLRQSRPAFLKSPTSSFFFVSTEIAGWFSVMAALTASLMTWNCASRSGLSAPSRVLLLACRLNFCFFSNSPTTVWLILCPSLSSSAASRRRLLHVQRSGDIGSPRASGSTSAFRSSSKPGSVSVNDLRPPPGRRTPPSFSGGGASSSFRPRPIVLAAMRVTRETAAMPPRPAALAGIPAASLSGQNRFSYSLTNPKELPPELVGDPTADADELAGRPPGPLAVMAIIEAVEQLFLHDKLEGDETAKVRLRARLPVFDKLAALTDLSGRQVAEIEHHRGKALKRLGDASSAAELFERVLAGPAPMHESRLQLIDIYRADPTKVGRVI